MAEPKLFKYIKNAAGYYPGPAMAATADGSPLQGQLGGTVVSFMSEISRVQFRQLKVIFTSKICDAPGMVESESNFTY